MAETEPETAARRTPSVTNGPWRHAQRGAADVRLGSSTDVPGVSDSVRFTLESSRTHRRACSGDLGTKLCHL